MLFKCVIFLFFIVPPGDPFIVDDNGQRLRDIIGPFDEGAFLTLGCEVDGGKMDFFYINKWMKVIISDKLMKLVIGDKLMKVIISDTLMQVVISDKLMKVVMSDTLMKVVISDNLVNCYGYYFCDISECDFTVYAVAFILKIILKLFC